MKVFSKQHKNNKSSPTLQSVALAATTINVSTKKSKGMNKIKTFKQILTQNIHGLTNAKQLNNHKQFISKSERNNNLASCRQKSFFDENSSSTLMLSEIKMINSIEQSKKAAHEFSKANKSTDRIQSIIYYGSKLRSITPFQNSFNSSPYLESDKIQKSIDLNLSILSNQSNKENKENLSTRIHKNKRQQKQNTFIENSSQIEFKKINHYKNTRVAYNHKVVVKRWGMKDFKIGKRLGKGRFGQVHLVEEKQSGLIFAMKKIDMVLVKQQDMQNQIIEQIKLQLYLNNPNILRMYGFFKEGQDLCMILQYAEERCLFNKLIEKIDEKNCHYYILQMVKALKYCHSQFVLHRDLKPQNILISFGVAKLADFGWAAYAPKYKRMTFCGTLDYVSPQILKGQWYDQRVDIWSLGVLIYELSTGRAPFQSSANNHTQAQRATMNRILKCDFSIPQTVSYELQKLIESILNSQPEDRPTLSQIECGAWMSKFKDEGLQIDKYIWQYWTSISEK